jgi:hypothetical protein
MRCAVCRQDVVPYSAVGSVKTVIRHVINKTASSHRGDSEKSHPVNKRQHPLARGPLAIDLGGFTDAAVLFRGPRVPP